MSMPLAAILGAVAGAVAFVVILIIVIWFCFFRAKSASGTSETGSSDPSLQRRPGVELTLREARQFPIEELSSATKNFSDKNLIGEGKFGAVYKGLLNDGILVAIKRRAASPTLEFVDEALVKFHGRS